MRYPARLTSRALILGSTLLCASQITAQDAATTDEDIVYLSPFEVTSEGTIGYAARDTLAGTRLRTDLRDVANAVQVVNSQFLQDTGATDTKSLLVYTTNTEVGGIGGNFSNLGDGSSFDDTARRVSPQSNTRVRGLSSADNARNFFLTRLPWDGYNVNRVEIQRGANAVLFGLGSPAGIVNTDVQGSSMFNEGKIEMKVGSYGTVRGSINVNRVLLDGELSVRIAGLYEDEQYRQDPAFERDERIFVAARWEPKFMEIGTSKLIVKASYEKGDIEANRPRISPPVDRISAWYNALGQKTYDSSIANNGNAADDDGGDQWGSTTVGTRNYTPWLAYWGSDYYGPVYIYDDVNSSSYSYVDSGQSVKVANGEGVGAGIGDIPTTNIFAFGIATTPTMATNAKLDGYDIGAWKSVVVQDTGIFDYYNNLIDGDTKRELEEWDAFNITATETFMDGLFGVDVSYDYQKDLQTYRSRISPNGYALCVDISQYYSDGTPNPNVGRAYVASRSYGYSDEEMRNSFRVTGYVDLDLKKFMDPDSLLTKILGRHVFQANYSHMVVNTVHRGWEGNTSGTGYYDSKAITEGAREVATLSYLSGSLTGTTSASQVNAQRINALRNPTDSSINMWNGTSYVNTPFDVWSDANSDDMDNLYIGSQCYDERVETESWGMVWNGYLLDSILVPTVSYREDEQKYFGSGAASINSANGIANFSDPEWYVPSSAAEAKASVLDTTKGNREYNMEKGDTTSWGIVARMPESLRKKMPLGLDISLFYNDSDNFRPNAKRVDLFGNTIAAEQGSTKDYGFTVSALDDKLMLKVNWYESKVNNADVGDAITNYYMLGMGEGWSYMYTLQALMRVGDFATDRRADTTVGDFQVWENKDGATDAETQALFHSVADAWFNTNADYTAALSNNPTYYPSEAFQRNWFNGTTFDDWLARVQAGGDPSFWGDINSGSSNMKVTGDIESEGIEFELSYQITPNWNLTANLAKTEAVRLNLAQTYSDFTDQRVAAYSTPYGQACLWGPWSGREILVTKWKSEYYGNFLLQKALEGANVPELCKWRFNLVTNYSFSEGMLKGMNIGGAYRWQDKTTIGYPLLYGSDGELVQVDGISQYDLNNPWESDYEQYFDLWIGYEHAINDDVTWRIQLNVKNLFADDDLIPVTVNPADDDGDGIYDDYSVASARIPEETTWYITNTFTF